MAKKKYRIHKIKIHPNRWFIWALAYTIIVAIGLISYIKISDLNFQTQLIAENTFTPWHSYSDKLLGFSVKYPLNWSIEAGADTSVSFVPMDSPDEGVTVSVNKLATEQAIRKPLKVSSEGSIVVDNVLGTNILNKLGGEQFEEVILLKHNQKLYVMRGTEELVQKLALTFHFIE